MEWGWLLALQLIFCTTTWLIFHSSSSPSPSRKRSRVTTRSSAIRRRSTDGSNTSQVSRSSSSSSSAVSSSSSSSSPAVSSSSSSSSSSSAVSSSSSSSTPAVSSSSSSAASPLYSIYSNTERASPSSSTCSMSSQMTALATFEYEEARDLLMKHEGLSKKSRLEGIKRFIAIINDYGNEICERWGETELRRFFSDLHEAIRTEKDNKIKLEIANTIDWLIDRAYLDRNDLSTPFTKHTSILLAKLMDDKIAKEITIFAANELASLLSVIKHNGRRVDSRPIWRVLWPAFKMEINDPKIECEHRDDLIAALGDSIGYLEKNVISVNEVEEMGQMIERCLDTDCDIQIVGVLILKLIKMVGTPICSLLHEKFDLFFWLADIDAGFWLSASLVEHVPEYALCLEGFILRSIGEWDYYAEPSDDTTSSSIVTLLTWMLKDAQTEELKRNTAKKSEEEGHESYESDQREEEKKIKEKKKIDSQILNNIAILFKSAKIKDGEVMPLVFSLINKCDEKQFAVSICATFIEKLPQVATKHCLEITDLFLNSLSNGNRFARYDAARSFGEMAMSGIAEWVKLAPQSISSLGAILDRACARSTTKASQATRKAIFALIKIIMKCDVDDETINDVLVRLINWMPTIEQHDTEDARFVYGVLADRIEKKNDVILEKAKSPELIQTLTEVIEGTLLDATDESILVKTKLVKFLTDL